MDRSIRKNTKEMVFILYSTKNNHFRRQQTTKLYCFHLLLQISIGDNGSKSAPIGTVPTGKLWDIPSITAPSFRSGKILRMHTGTELHSARCDRPEEGLQKWQCTATANGVTSTLSRELHRGKENPHLTRGSKSQTVKCPLFCTHKTLITALASSI